MPLRMLRKKLEATGSFFFFPFLFPAWNMNPVSGGEAAILQPWVQKPHIKYGEAGKEKALDTTQP